MICRDTSRRPAAPPALRVPIPQRCDTAASRSRDGEAGEEATVNEDERRKLERHIRADMRACVLGVIVLAIVAAVAVGLVIALAATR